MPSLQDYFGINPQTGLGIASQGIRSQDEFDQQTQQNLGNLLYKQALAQQANAQTQKTILDTDTERQLQPTKISVAKSAANTQMSDDQLKQTQNFYENMRTGAESLPPDQLAQRIQAFGQQFPGIANNPGYQSLLNTPPDQLNTAVKKMAIDGLLNTGDQLRKRQLQQMKDQTDLSVAGINQGGANSRNAATLAMQDKINQDNIAAGKFSNRSNKYNLTVQQSVQGSKNYQEASTKLQIAAMATDDPELKQQYEQKAEEFRKLALNQASAAAYPKMGIGDDGGIVQVNPYGQNVGGVPLTPPPSADTTPDIGAMAQRAFGGYDPSKYEYRVNPNTNKLQRKAK